MDNFSALSILVFLIFVFLLVYDLVVSTIHKLKGKPYEWLLVKFVEAIDGWFISVCLLAVVFYGAYTIIVEYGEDCSSKTASEYESVIEEMSAQEPELTGCYYCFEDFPKEYAYIDSKTGEVVCPRCLSISYNELSSSKVGKCYSCGDFYYKLDSHGFGLCEKCSLDELVPCDRCCELTYPWETDSGYTLCPRCIGDACNDPRIVRTINYWFEQ